MDDAGIEALRQFIRDRYDVETKYVSSELVHVVFDDAAVWQGEVTVFAVAGHAGGVKRCYAWSHETTGDERRFYAMLGLGPVIDAKTAVRSALVADANPVRFAGRRS